MFVPIFGWFAWKMKVIAVNRGKKSEALKEMSKTAKQQYEDGRQIIIYPEGTQNAFDNLHTNMASRICIQTSMQGFSLPL